MLYDIFRARRAPLTVCAAFWALCVLGGSMFHFMMGWNVLLAVLPLLFADCFSRVLRQGLRAAAAIFGLLFLLFFPNAPYMATDLIHVTVRQYYVTEPDAPSKYTRVLGDWGFLLFLAFAAAIGVLLGMAALDALLGALRAKWGRAAAGAALGCAALSGGFAIYIGRFLRLNSWDVLRPAQLLTRVLDSLDGFALRYSLLFAAAILGFYAVYRAFFRQGGAR